MIRRATPADVDGIARVHVQAWRESYSELMPQAAIEVGQAKAEGEAEKGEPEEKCQTRALEPVRSRVA